jgi:hypothetical protein
MSKPNGSAMDNTYRKQIPKKLNGEVIEIGI